MQVGNKMKTTTTTTKIKTGTGIIKRKEHFSLQPYNYKYSKKLKSKTQGDLKTFLVI